MSPYEPNVIFHLSDFKPITHHSEIFYKDAPNDTVKGFDAVHVVEASDGLELWLGEVKLYKDIVSAVRDVENELKQHTTISYLRSEFAAIWRKVDHVAYRVVPGITSDATDRQYRGAKRHV